MVGGTWRVVGREKEGRTGMDTDKNCILGSQMVLRRACDTKCMGKEVGWRYN